MCNGQLRQDIPPIVNETGKITVYEDFWDCFEQVPYYLYEIINCGYNGNL